MISLILLTLFSFVAGLAIGLNLAHKIFATAIGVIDIVKQDRKKNTGHVKLGVSSKPLDAPPRSSGVVRPKEPTQPTDETDKALAAVKTRVGL